MSQSNLPCFLLCFWFCVLVAKDFQGKQTVTPYSFLFQDPRGNRIFQWQNVTSEMNIIQIEFPLTEEPILGNYKIIVAKKSGDKTNHSFLVEEYGKCHPLFLFRIENIIRDKPLSINPFDC